MRLADALSGAFTVYVPDRRGRGRSEPYGEFHGLSTEIEDLSALLDASGATRVFGLSSGAVIAIEAALVRPDITKLALYQPPLTFDGVVQGEWAPRYEQQLTAGQPGAALVTVLKATADRTSMIRWIPGRPLGAVLDFAVKRTADRPARDGVMSPRELVPTVRYDAQTVNGAAGPLERFSVLSCEVLLLGGSRSARNLSASLDGLSRVLPGARRVVPAPSPQPSTAAPDEQKIVTPAWALKRAAEIRADMAGNILELGVRVTGDMSTLGVIPPNMTETAADPEPVPPPVPAEAAVQAIAGAFATGGVGGQPIEQILREIEATAIMRALVSRGRQRVRGTLRPRR